MYVETLFEKMTKNPLEYIIIIRKNLEKFLKGS